MASTEAALASGMGAPNGGPRTRGAGGGARRTLTTAQPVTTCSMCGRRLLRGERPETYLAAGREQATVCELCVPLARQAGWTRASDAPAMRQSTGRRGAPRSPLLSRLLRRAGRRGRAGAGAGEDAADDVAVPAEVREAEPPAAAAAYRVEPYAGAAEPYAGAAEPISPSEQALAAAAAEPRHEAPREGARAGRAPAGAVAEDKSMLREALTAFNATREPRRIAGIARSLGPPAVTVRRAGSSLVEVVVVWEICWYRWVVDLDAPLPLAELVDQGGELSELGEEALQANAAAGERGEIRLGA
jgi:hypothetical protein